MTSLGLGSVRGVLLRSEANAAGIDDRKLGRLVKAGVLVRIRHGAYAERATWESLDDVGRHVLLSEAVMRLYADHVALSHVSAVVAHDGPTWRMDLSQVHLTHLEGNGRKSAKIVHHRGSCQPDDLIEIDGHRVTSATRTALDVVTVCPAESAVVLVSDFLHRGLTAKEALRAGQETMWDWGRTINHHVVLRVADQRHESVGEARSAYLFWQQGLPDPEPQLDVFAPDGTFLGRVDFAWPDLGVIVEFDGLSKYTRSRRPGETLGDVVAREKRREDRIREATGWIVIRLTWDDLAYPVQTARRIRDAMRSMVGR